MIRTTPLRDPYNIGGSVPLRIGPTVKIAVWTLYQLRQIPATSCSAERSFSALRRIKMTDIQREKKIQCHVVGHKMPSVTESRGTGRNLFAIYADGYRSVVYSRGQILPGLRYHYGLSMLPCLWKVSYSYASSKKLCYET